MRSTTAASVALAVAAYLCIPAFAGSAVDYIPPLTSPQAGDTWISGSSLLVMWVRATPPEKLVRRPLTLALRRTTPFLRASQWNKYTIMWTLCSVTRARTLSTSVHLSSLRRFHVARSDDPRLPPDITLQKNVPLYTGKNASTVTLPAPLEVRND